jgi:hypothetical protein
MKLLFMFLRFVRDIKAISRGRLGQRIYNRGVSRGLRAVGRKLYR